MEKKEKFLAGLMAFTVSLGIGAGGMYLANKDKIDFFNKYPTFLETKKYMDKIVELSPPEEPGDEALIKAYLSVYGDEFTNYEATKDIESEEFIVELMNGTPATVGGGFRIMFNKSGQPYFSFVDDEKPAYEQGIRKGDIIVSVNGEKMEIPKNVKKLNGDEGEKISLVISRDGKEQTIDYICHTDKAGAAGITTENYGDVLYLQFEDFNDLLMEPLEEELEKQKFSKILIDLRQNPGGSILVGVEFADLFVDKGIVSLSSKTGFDEELGVSPDVKYNDPIVILIDGDSMSASEMVTALLKQYGDTTLVGTKTYGKGIYQRMGFFRNGTVTYTDGHVTVGEWDDYNEIGIEPDIEVDMDPKLIGTEKDIQLEAALDFIMQK